MNNQVIIEMLKKQEQTLQQLKKELSSPQPVNKEVDLEQINNLSEQLQTSITKIDGVVEEARKPIISERKLTLEIQSKGTLGLLIGMFTAIVLLAITTNKALTPNQSQQDNDLKYRYIKMKGEATPATILELETAFELERDNAKIRQMFKTVKEYEETVHKRAILDEQARLKQQESNRLNQEATKLKKK